MTEQPTEATQQPTLRRICPSCRTVKAVEHFRAPRWHGLEWKDQCTTCRREAATRRKARQRAERLSA